MTKARAPRCYRCTRTKEEGTGWERKEHYREGVIYLHETCPERVCLKNVAESSRSVRMHTCGRDGRELTPEGWLCGRHLAGYRRRQQTNRQFRQKRDASDANLQRAKIAADVLAELGIDAKPYYDALNSRHDGRIVVDPAEIFRLAGIGLKLPTIQEQPEIQERPTAQE